MINQFVVVARLAQDPRIIPVQGQDGSTVNMTSGLLIADVGTKEKPKTVPMSFIGFGEGIQKLRQGTKIIALAELTDNSYMKDGQKVYGPNSIKINMWEYAESKSVVDARNQQKGIQASADAQAAQAGVQYGQQMPQGYTVPQGAYTTPAPAPVPQQPQGQPAYTAPQVPQTPQGYTVPQGAYTTPAPAPVPQQPQGQPAYTAPQASQISAPPVQQAPNPAEYQIPENLPFN